jgi:hypothetical protein
MLIDRVCEHCSSPFQVQTSRLKHGRGRHCSPACQYAAIKARPTERVALTCIGCGGQFTRSPGQLRNRRGAGKYCTRDCRDLHWIGDKNPLWQNAGRLYTRGPNWQAVKRAIKARDGQCIECGAAERLHVHHKVPFRMFERVEDANDPDNLITLCAPCHRRIEAEHKWVRLGSGHIIQMNAGGAAWQLARERGMI